MKKNENNTANGNNVPAVRSEEILAKAEHIPEFDRVIMIAERLFKSGLFVHLKNPEQAVAIVEFGREMGVQPMQSLQLMAVISSKLAIQAQLMLALAKKKGCDVEIVETTASKCEIKFIRDGKKHQVFFTYKEAKDLNLTHKDNWKKQPANMLFWRCVSRAIRRHAPDLILGAYSIEEVTEGEFTTVKELQEVQSVYEEKPTDTIIRLLEQKEIPEKEINQILEGINDFNDEQTQECIEWLNKQPEKKPSTAEDILKKGKNNKKDKDENATDGKKKKEEPKQKKKSTEESEHDSKFIEEYKEAYIECAAKGKKIHIDDFSKQQKINLGKIAENKVKKMSKEEAEANLKEMQGALK